MAIADSEYHWGRAVDARQREAAASCEASMKAHSDMAERHEQLSGYPEGLKWCADPVLLMSA
jgi:hypothetical protein